ncbi:MAG: hypothetical protein OXB95_10845 [Rhodobacteraceae bacterium]|nr:hypothetical protein [Paracoccaceae bacterium]
MATKASIEFFRRPAIPRRFVCLMPRQFMPCLVPQHCLSGERHGFYIVDSSRLSTCHHLRARGPRMSFDKRVVGYCYTATGHCLGLKL